ncbi:MAG: phosphoglycerate dehydrogenase-like enzyme [Phycisphaerales bacterium]|jgi:phosphoglycerate dehydrogenase-like enzyme
MDNDSGDMALVIEAEPISPEPRAWLCDRCELVRCPQDDAEKFEALLARAQALIVRSYTRVDAALLSGAPHLRVVARAGVGLDNIDLPACNDRGIAVVHTPEANADAVCELFWATVFDVIRPRLYLDKPLSRPRWEQTRAELIAPRSLAGHTLGVLGLGRVGSRVAAVGTALGMRVLYHDVKEIDESARAGANPASGAHPVSFDELLDRSDVLTLHVDGRPANRHLLGPRELARLRADVVLVNMARGFVIDPVALADFAINNHASHSILDVHEPEPFGEQYPLLDIPNVRLLPHIGAATADAKRNMSWVVRDVWRVLQGEAPHHAAAAAPPPLAGPEPAEPPFFERTQIWD